MKSIRSRFARTVATIMCATILVLTPVSASAQWTDFVAVFQRVLHIVQAVGTYLATDGVWIKEYFLDYLEKGIAVQLENTIIDNTREWARTGFDGQPSFILNPKDLITGAEGNEAELFTAQINQVLANICSPYQAKVTAKIAQARQNRRQTSDRDQVGTARITGCNLNNLVTNGAIQNYHLQGGYENEGGLAVLLQALADDADNPYAIEDLVVAEQKRRQDAAVAEAKSEVSGGVLPNRFCARLGLGGECERYENLTPAGNVEAILSKGIGHSLDDLAGQDELSEIFLNTIVRQFTQEILSTGLRR